MPDIFENENNTELLDQMLEDLAGEEFEEFDFESLSGLDQFSSLEDEFAEIDTQH